MSIDHHLLFGHFIAHRRSVGGLWIRVNVVYHLSGEVHQTVAGVWVPEIYLLKIKRGMERLDGSVYPFEAELVA